MYELNRNMSYRVLRIINHIFINSNWLFLIFMRLITINTPLSYTDLKALNRIMQINTSLTYPERESHLIDYFSFYDLLAKKIESTSKKWNYWTYKFLYMLMISRGLYSFALVFKNEMIIFLNNHQLSRLSGYLNNELFLMSLENVEFEKDITFFKCKSLDGYNTKLRNIYLNVNRIVHNPIYSNYLNNKKIAVVGPATSTRRNGNDIDSFDIIVRPKYKSEFTRVNHEFIGGRTSVSYLQYSKLEDVDFESLRDLDFAINSDDKLNNLLNESHNKNLIGHGLNNTRLWSGYTTHLNKILFHLIFNCSDLNKVKLFNFNFYLSKNLYFLNYRGNPRTKTTEYIGKDLEKLWQMHSWHDVLSNWSQTKNLVNKYHFDTSEEIRNLLNIDSFEFMDRMDKLYGYFRK